MDTQMLSEDCQSWILRMDTAIKNTLYDSTEFYMMDFMDSLPVKSKKV